MKTNLSILSSAALVLVFIVLGVSGCGSRSEDVSIDSPKSADLPHETPELVESFVLEDLAGRPTVTFVEFKNETIVTVRDADGVRTESLRVYIDEDYKRFVERAPYGEDWAKRYASVEPIGLATEFPSFRFYLKAKMYSQVQGCRRAKAWQDAADSIRRKVDPVLFSVQARRKQKARKYEALIAIDFGTGRYSGITIDRGAEATALTDLSYAAVAPHWVLDGQPSGVLLGTKESYEFDLRCRIETRALNERASGRPGTASREDTERELAIRVDGDFKYRPRLRSIYDDLSSRQVVGVGFVKTARSNFLLKFSEEDLEQFYSAASPK